MYGLLCDEQGRPVSIEAFAGNTSETKTFGSEVRKVADRFGAETVTLVGDRGMIQGPKIDQIHAEEGLELHYITAITKPQIETLLKQDVIQINDVPRRKIDGDIASQLVDGVDRFLLRKIDEATPRRDHHWTRDFSSAEAYERSLAANRDRLAHILGVRDPRVPFDAPQLIATTERSALVANGDGFEAYAVRWRVIGHPQPYGENTVSVYAEGLLLVPTGGKQPVASIIALPDADQTPEQIAGLAEGVAPESQFARRLAENGCRVLVPTLISRELKPRRGRAKMTNREFIHRAAFELGRHLIGFEVQKILAGVDWFVRDAGENDPAIAVVGYGEGGMLALYVGGLDNRIDGVCVSGFFGPRETMESCAVAPSLLESDFRSHAE